MQNHDVMRREQQAAAAASAALGKVELPRRAQAKIEEICLTRLYTDVPYILVSVVSENLRYWKHFGLMTAMTRKLRIGDHPYR